VEVLVIDRIIERAANWLFSLVGAVVDFDIDLDDLEQDEIL